VPTPIFSGQTRFTTPNAISFAPATTKFATPMTHGTLMIDFAAEPRVLRDWDDLFPAESFIELVITVRVNVPQLFFLFRSSAHSGPVSRSGESQWHTSSGAGTTSLAQN
jgi:hypothetical protein